MQYKQVDGNRQNLPKSWTLKDGSQTGNFDLLPEFVHNDEGWYQCEDDPIIEDPATQKLGNDLLVGNKWSRSIILMTQEESSNRGSAKRLEISTMISQIAEQQSDIPRQGYSVTEASRWSRDQLAVEAGDWSRFSVRAGKYMTGQQYAETRIRPKMDAGDAFVDKVIAKRNNLLVELSTTLDEELDDFDYTSVWDEETDYVPPPVEEVSESAWSELMGSIPFNIKLW